MHVHVEGSRCCHLIPSCVECNREGGHLVQQGRWRPDSLVVPSEQEPEPERAGLGPDDRRWRVPWLADLRVPPADASWPRLMSVPHRRAVGSLGAEFVGWGLRRGRAGRCGGGRGWRRHGCSRSTTRSGSCGRRCCCRCRGSSGRSWLLRRALLVWRIHQGARFGGVPQDVLHTGKRDLAVCKDGAAAGAGVGRRRGPEFKVREVNGQEEIELLADGSRWMLRAEGGRLRSTPSASPPRMRRGKVRASKHRGGGWSRRWSSVSSRSSSSCRRRTGCRRS